MAQEHDIASPAIPPFLSRVEGSVASMQEMLKEIRQQTSQLGKHPRDLDSTNENLGQILERNEARPVETASHENQSGDSFLSTGNSYSLAQI